MSILAAVLFCAAAQAELPAGIREILKDPSKVVPFKECEPLVRLLREGKVKEFNEQRRAQGEKYLDFGDHLKGGFARREGYLDLDLGGIDLSRVLFGPTRWNGCALDRADFSGSYLQDVLFYDPPWLSESGQGRPGQEYPASFGARPTTLAGAKFRGCTLGGRAWNGLDYVDASKIVADGAVQQWIAGPDFARRNDRRVRELSAGASVLELSAIGAGGRALDLKEYGVEIENPFLRMDDAAEKEWKEAGIDPAAVKGLKALRINVHSPFDWVNSDARTLFVVGEGFFSHRSLYSRGPVLLTGQAHLMGDVFSDSWVACLQQSFPRGLIHASKVLVSAQCSGGQARSLMSPVARGEFGLGKPKEDWLRRTLETSSAKTVAARLHPGSKDVVDATSMGKAADRKDLYGDGASPFADRPEIDGLPILLLDAERLKTFEGGRGVVVNDDPRRVVAVPSVFGNRAEVLYSEGPVLVLDKDRSWSSPRIVSRSLVRGQRPKAPRDVVAFDPPAAAAPFEPDRGTKKPLPETEGGGAGVQMLSRDGVSLVVVLRGGRPTHTVLAAGPMGTQLEPGVTLTLGEKTWTADTPEGLYVGFPESGFQKVDAAVTESLVATFRKYEAENKGATLSDFLRSQPIGKHALIRKLLKSAK